MQGVSCLIDHFPGKLSEELVRSAAADFLPGGRYPTAAAPVLGFAQALGPLVYEVRQTWPVQIFGMTDNHELVELWFSKTDTAYIVGRRNVSGVWWENL